MVNNGCYLICIFMNFNENIKKDRKIVNESINKLLSCPNYHCDTFFFLKPVISYDKFIDVMRLNENYLIYIFMNINVKNRGKMRKETIAIAKF